MGRQLWNAWGNRAGRELGLPRAMQTSQREPLLAQGLLLAVPATGHFGEGTGGDIEDEQLELLQPVRDDPRWAGPGLGYQKTNNGGNNPSCSPE